MAEATAHDHVAHGKPSFFVRWFMSTNHKDIGILYLVTSAIVGFIAVAFTMYMRLELMEPELDAALAGSQTKRHLAYYYLA